MFGQAFEVAEAVMVDVWVVVTVRAVGFARDVVRVSSRRLMQVEVEVMIEVEPGQGGREVERGEMCGLR